MPWTTEQQIAYLLRLPWTLSVQADDEADEFLIRCTEMPSAIGSGTRKTVESDFWGAMRAALSAYLHFGDPIPLPSGVRALPWSLPSLPAPAGALENQAERQTFQAQSTNGGTQIKPVPETATEVQQFREMAVA